jgi:hypothetical protein
MEKNWFICSRSISEHTYVQFQFYIYDIPAGSASKPKLSTSSWWSRGNTQWAVQQMRVSWRAGFQHLKTGTFD